MSTVIGVSLTWQVNPLRVLYTYSIHHSSFLKGSPKSRPFISIDRSMDQSKAFEKISGLLQSLLKTRLNNFISIVGHVVYLGSQFKSWNEFSLQSFVSMSMGFLVESCVYHLMLIHCEQNQVVWLNINKGHMCINNTMTCASNNCNKCIF